MKYILYVLLICILSSCFRSIEVQDTKPVQNTPQVEITPTLIEEENVPAEASQEKLTQWDTTISPWITGLSVPWSLVFLDDNTALVTERGWRITKIISGEKQDSIYFEVPSVEYGEWGLLGIEKDPDYENNKYIYVMYMYLNGAEQYKERVIRLIDDWKTAREDITLIDNIPAAKYHNGGRIKFGPEGKLYITTWDALDPNIAQDMQSLWGKILRINADGSIPEDNPFPESAIYTLGHRNPQWITWDPNSWDTFISTHGPSWEFFLTARDRIDHLKTWANYGWPIVAGYSENYEDPLAYWPDKATPPGGMAFWNGSLFVATLKSEALVQLDIEPQWDSWNLLSENRWFENEYGRLRDAIVWPDDSLYILTSNADGKGDAEAWWDIILKVSQK